MVKDNLDLKLNLNETPASPQEKQPQGKSPNNKKQPKKGSGKANLTLGQRIVKFFREIVSELKKVDWPPLKRTKNNPGVFANTVTVLILTMFFLIIITAFDFGLTALLRLLTGTGS